MLAFRKGKLSTRNIYALELYNSYSYYRLWERSLFQMVDAPHVYNATQEIILFGTELHSRGELSQ